MQNQRTRILVEIALAIALAVVLNFVAMRLPINIAGGSISLTMLPIAVIALRRGPISGAFAGTLFGFLDLIMEPFILVPAQVALDYPVPYLLFGFLVGVFSPFYLGIRPRPANAATMPTVKTLILAIAVITGGLFRFACHVLSGVIFFYEYAGNQNVWIYSLVYNVSYLGPSLLATIVCAIVVMPVLDRALPVVQLDVSASRGNSK